MRDTLFISHAFPDDNEFARWLALQLAKEGYPVWCDVTKLLGGEHWWQDIEQAIRTRTIKILFVASRQSNQREGCLQELHIGSNTGRREQLENFIIPLMIDDLPPTDLNIHLANRIALFFNRGWARGLDQLLVRLAEDQIPKHPNFTPEAVASWWRSQFSAEQGIEATPEPYLSNWFPIDSLPINLYFQTLTHPEDEAAIEDALSQAPFPAFQHGRHLVSFTYADDFRSYLEDITELRHTQSYSVRNFIDRKVPNFLQRNQGRDFIIRLLRQAWEKKMRSLELTPYDLSDRSTLFFFPKNRIENDTIRCTIDGHTIRRSLVGKRKTSHWHFGINAKPIVYPTAAYVLKSHVVFSDDGQTVWASKDRLHKARRNQCKQWWNAEWRDRLLASVHYFTQEEGHITIPLGRDTSIEVQPSPLHFTSPLTYTDPSFQPLDDTSAEDFDDDELLEDSDDA